MNVTASADPKVPITVEVNDVMYKRAVSPRLLLSDFLRYELRLTGTHVGCEHGVCGCCTVLIDNRAARSCLTLAVQVDGSRVTTVEGLRGPGGTLHPVQEAMRDCHALQCGFCTPGFVMSIYAYLSEPTPDLSEQGAREAISGNLCRCTGYRGILQAVQRAARLMGQVPDVAQG